MSHTEDLKLISQWVCVIANWATPSAFGFDLLTSSGLPLALQPLELDQGVLISGYH